MGIVQSILDFLGRQSAALIYLVVGLGAGIENLFPPIPADTFVLFGAFLAARGKAVAWVVLLVTWAGNVSTALLTYWLARRYGRSAFETRVGHFILHPGQLERIGGFYERHGRKAIFLSRFLPALRAVVPIFAGVSGLGFFRTALPLATASLLWYGVIVVIGTVAGRNWSAIRDAFGQYNLVLTVIAVLLIAGIGVWWWKTRHEDE